MSKLVYNKQKHYNFISVLIEPDNEKFRKKVLEILNNVSYCQESVIIDNTKQKIKYICYTVVIWGSEKDNILNKLVKLFEEHGYKNKIIKT